MPRRADLRVWIALGVLVVVLGGITAYEHLAWGWHFAREVAPGDSAWHWARAAIAAVLSLFAVVAIAGAALPQGMQQDPVDSAGLAAGWLVLAFAVGLTGLLLVDPLAYRAAGEEDGLVEWASSIALFLGCAFSAMWLAVLLRGGGQRNFIALLAATGFTALFFVMGMEEISWGQRLFGFDTPEAMKAENWQGEFNLHNMQTDLAEYALYGATGVFLVFLPLVREALSGWRIVAPFARLLPDRSVALVSAPMLAFNYARWDLLPMQAVYFAGLAACVVFAASARRGGRGQESAAFVAVAVFLFAGQAIHLLAGHTMTQIYDESEFREAILAFGIGWYGLRQWRAARRLAGMTG